MKKLKLTNDMRAALSIEMHELRQEIKRIAGITLRSKFKIEADKKYWVDRLKMLNSKLNHIEQDYNWTQKKEKL